MIKNLLHKLYVSLSVALSICDLRKQSPCVCLSVFSIYMSLKLLHYVASPWKKNMLKMKKTFRQKLKHSSMFYFSVFTSYVNIYLIRTSSSSWSPCLSLYIYIHITFSKTYTVPREIISFFFKVVSRNIYYNNRYYNDI